MNETSTSRPARRAESLIYLLTEISADPVTIRVSPEQRVQPGDEMPVRVERGRFHLFGATGELSCRTSGITLPKHQDISLPVTPHYLTWV